MEKIFLDLTNEDKVSVIKEKARQTVLNDLVSYFKDRYEDSGMLASNEIGVVVGCARDENGFSSDVVVTVKISTKAWYDKTDCKRPVKRFSLYEGTDGTDGVEAYEAEMKAKKALKK